MNDDIAFNSIVPHPVAYSAIKMNFVKSNRHLNRRTATLVATGLISAASVLRADQNAPAATTNSDQTSPTNSPPAAASSTAPLMAALGAAGLSDPLNKVGINVYGYVEGGYFHDFS